MVGTCGSTTLSLCPRIARAHLGTKYTHCRARCSGASTASAANLSMRTTTAPTRANGAKDTTKPGTDECESWLTACSQITCASDGTFWTSSIAFGPCTCTAVQCLACTCVAQTSRRTFLAQWSHQSSMYDILTATWRCIPMHPSLSPRTRLSSSSGCAPDIQTGSWRVMHYEVSAMHSWTQPCPMHTARAKMSSWTSCFWLGVTFCSNARPLWANSPSTSARISTTTVSTCSYKRSGRARGCTWPQPFGLVAADMRPRSNRAIAAAGRGEGVVHEMDAARTTSQALC